MQLTKDKPESYYQFELKQVFFEKYPTATQRPIKVLFRHLAKFEKTYGKDLHSFTPEELEMFLKSLRARTIRSLDNTLSTIHKYIQFSVEEGHTLREDSPISLFNYKEAKNRLIDHDNSENMLFTENEIMSMAMETDNAQDGVIIALIFEGLNHKNAFNELVNLKYKDVDFNNHEIHLPDRTINISPETATLINDAYNQKKYVSVNGKQSRTYDMKKAGYVLKGIRGKSQVKPQRISQALIRIARLSNIDNLRATTILYSGQNHYAKTLLSNIETVHAITRQEIREAAVRTLNYFGLPDNKSAQHYLMSRIENNFDDIRPAQPEKNTTTIDRLKRNQLFVKVLKKLYNHTCQVCQSNLTEIEGIPYSEVHHIRPYNDLHKGPDDVSNCIVLCPNHHKLFDLGVISIDPRDERSLVHLDEKNILHGQIIDFKHSVKGNHIRYAYTEVFLPRKIELNQ